jgi:hypothetical protein
MSHEDRDEGHDGRDGPDGPQGGSRRADKAAEGLAPPGREEEIPEPLKLMLADLPAPPEDAVRIVPDPSCRRRRAMTVLPVEGAACGSAVTAPWPISPTGSTGG